jgi:hypothetical protein
MRVGRSNISAISDNGLGNRSVREPEELGRGKGISDCTRGGLSLGRSSRATSSSTVGPAISHRGRRSFCANQVKFCLETEVNFVVYKKA